ncbi:predicted protein [Nematostella vectensis]|uniref:GOLD domain-containing protein n=1 Tax=Nematostella vectensis TaxID=45351 RepID=A7SKI6_NEMVE|nr:transmembrane emp24 domain-containing protein 5 [Nematostella vectensis]EDO35763.1 predicted protein [Nematostella vectensis]|eukprot:XP_001627826.1 predicted protein [Nematostella vectensis]
MQLYIAGRVSWLTLCVGFFVLQQTWRPSSALKSGFTFRVDPGKRDCFYETIKRNVTLDVEYQVIEGGDLDIGFTLQAPSGKIAIEDGHRTDEAHSLVTEEEGEYEFCFDNTFSTVASKAIFADLGVDFEDDIQKMIGIKDENLEEDLHDRFVRTLENVRVDLDKAEHIQNFISSAAARDFRLAKSKDSRVFWWSLIQSVALIGVAIVQVNVVKHFFGGGKTRV